MNKHQHILYINDTCDLKYPLQRHVEQYGKCNVRNKQKCRIKITVNKQKYHIYIIFFRCLSTIWLELFWNTLSYCALLFCCGSVAPDRRNGALFLSTNQLRTMDWRQYFNFGASASQRQACFWVPSENKMRWMHHEYLQHNWAQFIFQSNQLGLSSNQCH